MEANKVWDKVQKVCNNKEIVDGCRGSDIANAGVLAPVLCGCKEHCEREQIKNGLLFIASNVLDEFDIKDFDLKDANSRIDILFRFDGDEDKKRVLKNRIALRACSDQKADVDEDKGKNQPNPFLVNALNAEAKYTYMEVVSKESNGIYPEIDKALSMEASVSRYW